MVSRARSLCLIPLNVDCSQSCRKRTIGKVEIPESPEADESDPETKERPDTITGATSFPLQIVPDYTPHLWFQTGLVKSTMKIKRKKVGRATPNDRDHQSKSATEYGTSPSPYHVVPLCHHADAILQAFVPNTGSGSNLATEHQHTTSMHPHGASCQQMRSEQQPTKDSERHDYKATVPQQVSHGGSTRSGSMCIASSTSSDNEQAPTPDSVLPRNKGSDVKLEEDNPIPPALIWDHSKLSSRLPTSRRASMDQSAKCNESPSKKRYTMRQLARIALVAASGQRMTTSQISIWLARTFSYLQLGKGVWESQVRSCLAHFAEFHGTKVSGARDNKKLYGFIDAETRAKYEAEHSEFLATARPASTLEQPEQDSAGKSEPRKIGERQPKRAVKSAPTMPQSILEVYHHIQATSPRHQSAIPAREHRNDTAIMPFERSTPRRLFHLLDPDRGITQGTTHENAMLPYPAISVETMSKAEKAEKIKQIKGRPSRKTYFGSGHRLAHKRRHNLDDIHDERKGAWKPSVTTAGGMTNQAMDLDDESNRTLRQVFNLPDKMIPVNDGQTELAFKDGTQVGGRSARSRTMYKVGKMFGGELTISTS